MGFPRAVPNPASGTQLKQFSRWFHEHGIAWSGTPAELASELSTIQFGEGFFATCCDADQVFVWLETNAQVLREYDIDASVHKHSGQPRIICLQRTAARARPILPKTTQIGDDSQSKLKKHTDAEQDLVESRATLFGEKLPRKQRLKLAYAKNGPVPVATPPHQKPCDEIGDGLGGDVPSAAFNSIESDQPLRAPLRLSPIIALILVFGALITLASYKRLTRSHRDYSAATTEISDSPDHSQAPRVSSSVISNNPSANQTTADASGNDGDASRDTNELIREANEQRRSASEYELGVRYAEGRGVARDKVAAYVWLVLARFNGDQRTGQLLKDLTKQLSPDELRKVRIALGDSFARGLGAKRDMVLAYSWYSLAELAGAAEGKIKMQELQSRMTPVQVRDAEARTTAWLRRH